jgi:hypothetical protein
MKTLLIGPVRISADSGLARARWLGGNDGVVCEPQSSE